MVNNYEIIRFSNAKEAIERLRLASDEWHMTHLRRTEWRFRGHGNADWALLPSALRPEALQEYKNRWAWFIDRMISDSKDLIEGDKVSNTREYLLQHLVEAYLLMDFNNLCNELSFPRLDCSVYKINPRLLKHLIGEEQFVWKPSIAHAIAQHHGIPTRLLDWSEYPLFALYFAVNDALKLEAGGNAPKSIAVWAYNSMAIPMWQGISKEFVVDRSFSTFVRSQHGVFTWVDADVDFLESGKWITFNEGLARSINIMNQSQRTGIEVSRWRDFTEVKIENVLKKFEIDFKFVRDLFILLSRERITTAHLMPTLDNIAKTTMQFAKF